MTTSPDEKPEKEILLSDYRPSSDGIHVKDLSPEGGNPRCIHVAFMIFNLRITLWHGDCREMLSSPNRIYYCFPKKGDPIAQLKELIGKAEEWDGISHSETEPTGWVKAVDRPEEEVRYSE